MKQALVFFLENADYRFWLKFMAFSAPVNIILEYAFHAKGLDAFVLAMSVFVLSFFFVKPTKKGATHD